MTEEDIDKSSFCGLVADSLVEPALVSGEFTLYEDQEITT